MLICGEVLWIIVFILVDFCCVIWGLFVDLKDCLIIDERILMDELNVYFVISDEDFKDVEIVDYSKLLKIIFMKGVVVCVRFWFFF